MNRLLCLILFLAGLAASPAALPHGGEDHVDAPHPVAANLAPRFEARSEAYEVVGILDGADLVLFLDRADSNAPIAKAVIDVEAGAFKARATAGKSGEFRLPAGPLAKPGKHALTLTVETDDDSDLLAATLDIGTAAPARSEAPTQPAHTVPVTLGVAALVAAVIGAVLAARMVSRRRQA